MSTVFYVGPSTPLYTFTFLCVIIIMMFVAKVDVDGFVQRLRNKKVAPSPTTDKGQKVAYGWTNAVLIIWIFLSYASMIVWWAYTGPLGVSGYKLNWITSCMVISSFPLIMESGMNLGGLAPYLSVKVKPMGVEATSVETTNKSIYATERYAGVLYHAYFLSLVLLLLMSLLCLFMFGAGGKSANPPAWALLGTASIITAMLFFDALSKTVWGGETNSQRLKGMMREKRDSVQRYLFDTVKVPTVSTASTVESVSTGGLSKFKNLPPLTFAQTGNLTFPRDNPENLFLHHVELKQLNPQTTGALNRKDFACIQTNDNEVLVMSTKMAKGFLEEVPGGELNFAHTGSLYHHAPDQNETDEVDKVVDNETFFFRIFETEPGVIMYQDGVLGYFPGNGVFFNVPACIPWFLMLYFLACNIQIWKDTGYGLVFTIIAFLPAFMYSLADRQRSYIPLMFLNLMLATSAIVVSRNFGFSTTLYLMQPTVLYDDTSLWMQNATYPGGVTTQDQLGGIVSVAFTTYLALSSVLLWAFYGMVYWLYLMVNKKKKDS